MKFGLKVTVVATIASITGACASTKPVVQTPPPPVERTSDKPVFEDVTPDPVVQAPVQDVTPLPTIVDAGPIPGSTADFLNAAGDRVFFGYNQYSLDERARSALKAQADWLNAYPNVIVIVAGNADERGTREYNLALGARRAEAVKDYLVSQGVNQSRLTTVSYGKERPIADGSDERSWALNRNGHTTIVSGASS